MTVDSELRRIWRKDIAALVDQVTQLKAQVDQLELEVATHHPRIGLHRENAPAVPPGAE